MCRQINSLPSEVLRQVIFTICYDNLNSEYDEDPLGQVKAFMGAVHRISAVCSDIRSVTLSTPQLWTIFHLRAFHDAEELRLWLDRSGDAPLRVYLYESLPANRHASRTPEVTGIFMEELVWRRQRWEYLAAPGTRYFSMFMGRFDDTAGGDQRRTLPSLKIFRYDLTKEPHAQEGDDDALGSWSMPALESLSVKPCNMAKYVGWTCAPSNLSRLTVERIQCSREDEYANLVSLLSGFSRLTCLALDFLRSPSRGGDVVRLPNKTVSLPSLRHLRFLERQEEDVEAAAEVDDHPWALFNIISAPSVQSIQLASFNISCAAGPTSVLQAHGPSLQQVRYVTITEKCITPDTWHALMQLPLLTELTIKYSLFVSIETIQWRPFPSLRDIHLFLCSGVSDAFIRGLTKTLRDGDGWERIETVKLTGCIYKQGTKRFSLSFSPNNLEAMLAVSNMTSLQNSDGV